MLVTALISLLILIFVAVILHCGIALVASYSEAGKSRLHGIPTQSRRQVIDGILRFVLSFFCFFVGDNWRSWNNVARLALVYYILLPNLMYFRAAESLQNEQWHFRAPFVYLIIMNSWILINFSADYVSYNVSRDLIQSFLDSKTGTVRFVALTICKDLAVALALLCFVVLSTNLFHYLYESPEATFSLPTLLEYVFNVKNHGVEFSMVINDTKFFSFPGLAVVSLSTFFPSIFWGVSLALSYLAIPIRNWRRKLDDEVARERAESPSLLQYRMKYFGILAGAVGGLITVLKIQAG